MPVQRISLFCNVLLLLAMLVSPVSVYAAEKTEADADLPLPFEEIVCEGSYPRHLQGVCYDSKGNIYWCFTTTLVKTNSKGHVLQQIPVANHHGDLCHVDGKLFVAVNLGKFNQPEGQADSWVYEYDAESLRELAKHPTPEAIHGAGGIDYHKGRFIVVGGLPDSVQENYLFEYGVDWKFLARHVLPSGQTHLGIQTATFHDGMWWFGCYGKPEVLLKASSALEYQGQHQTSCSLGLIGLAPGRFLVARGRTDIDKKMKGAKLVPAVSTREGDLKWAHK